MVGAAFGFWSAWRWMHRQMMVAVAHRRSSPSGATLGGALHFGSLWWSIVLLREGRTLAGIAAQALRFVALAGGAGAHCARRGPRPFSPPPSGSWSPGGFLCGAIGGSDEVAADDSSRCS